MKRAYMLLLCCAAIVGCSRQSDFYVNEKQIGMEVFVENGYYTDALTKGALVEDKESINGFGAAVYCGDDLAIQYAAAQKIQGEDNLWSFPAGSALLCGDTFTCYAMSPTQQDGRSGISVVSGEASFTYSLPSCNSSAQNDLLMAVSSVTVHKSDETVVIPLHFEHPLSAVKFSIKAGIEGLSISRIALTGLSSAATCSTTTGNDFIWSDYSGKAEYEMSGDDTFVVIPQVLGPDAAAIIDVVQDGVAKHSVTSLDGVELEPGHALRLVIGKEGEVTIVGSSAIDFTNESEDIFQ